jgi:hypothetical protein
VREVEQALEQVHQVQTEVQTISEVEAQPAPELEQTSMQESAQEPVREVEQALEQVHQVQEATPVFEQTPEHAPEQWHNQESSAGIEFQNHVEQVNVTEQELAQRAAEVATNYSSEPAPLLVETVAQPALGDLMPEQLGFSGHTETVETDEGETDEGEGELEEVVVGEAHQTPVRRRRRRTTPVVHKAAEPTNNEGGIEPSQS